MTRWQCFPGSQQEPRGVKGSTGRRPCSLSTAGLSRDSAALWRPQGAMLCGFWKMMKRTPGVDVAQVGAPLGPADAVSLVQDGQTQVCPKRGLLSWEGPDWVFVRVSSPLPPPCRLPWFQEHCRSLDLPSLSPHTSHPWCVPPSFPVSWCPAPQ